MGQVATVAPVSQIGPDQLDILLRRLLPTPVLPPPPPQPVPSDFGIVVTTDLGGGVQAPKPTYQ